MSLKIRQFVSFHERLLHGTSWASIFWSNFTSTCIWNDIKISFLRVFLYGFLNFNLHIMDQTFMICLVLREANLHPTFDVVILLRMIGNSNRNSVNVDFLISTSLAEKWNRHSPVEILSTILFPLILKHQIQNRKWKCSCKITS